MRKCLRIKEPQKCTHIDSAAGCTAKSADIAFEYDRHRYDRIFGRSRRCRGRACQSVVLSIFQSYQYSGIVSGSTIYISQFYGKRDFDSMQLPVAYSMFLCFAASAIFAACSIVFPGFCHAPFYYRRTEHSLRHTVFAGCGIYLPDARDKSADCLCHACNRICRCCRL